MHYDFLLQMCIRDSYYSVPCGYIGKKGILLYTSREVCIYDGYELSAYIAARHTVRCVEETGLESQS